MIPKDECECSKNEDCAECGFSYDGPPDSYWQQQLESGKAAYESYASQMLLAERGHLL